MFVLKRAPVALLASVLLLAAASADAGWQRTGASGATARAYAIRVRGHGCVSYECWDEGFELTAPTWARAS